MHLSTALSVAPLLASLVTAAVTPSTLSKRNRIDVYNSVYRVSPGWSVNAATDYFLTVNGYANFAFQTDGNFAFSTVNLPVWSSNTNGNSTLCPAGSPNCSLTFQKDGNLVVTINGVPKWESGTSGNGNSAQGNFLTFDIFQGLTIQDYGNNTIWNIQRGN